MNDDTTTEDIPQPYDLPYMAWTLLANVSEGDWTKQTPEWQGAVVRWRDEFHAWLADGTAPTEPTGAVGGGAGLIAAERLRQVTAEGWTPEHDAEHAGGDLAMAAAAYAIHDANGCPLIARGFALWPFEPNGWKPRGQIDNLVRAGALIAAEIDRLNGTAPTEPAPTGLEPAAAPLVDTAAVREIAALFDPPHPADAGLLSAASDELDTLREAGKVVVADADAAWAEVARQRTELDTHHARRAELVALVAEWRASGEAATENPGLRAVMLARADELARILGEQP